MGLLLTGHGDDDKRRGRVCAFTGGEARYLGSMATVSRPVFVLSVACAGLAAAGVALFGNWLREADKVALLRERLKAADAPFCLATMPYPRANDGRLNPGTDQRHRQQCDWAEASAKAGGGAVVLVGDSITQAWEGQMDLLKDAGSFVNLGTSGDRTENVLWRLRNGNLPRGLDPRAFVVMIGTNNTGHRMDKPEDIAAGILAILDEIQGEFPRTPVILYRIFPRGAQPDDKMRLNNAAASDLVAKAVAGRPNVQVRELAPRLLQPDGTLSKEIMPDLLHLSKKGYEIWAADLREALK